MNDGDKKSDVLSRWLKRAIWCFGGISGLGIVIAAVLASQIYSLSGWNAAPHPQGRPSADGGPQSSSYITSVLITVQNQPLDREGVPADMIFTVTFNALEQRLTAAAISGEAMMDAPGQGLMRLKDVFARGGPELLARTVGEAFGIDLYYYANTSTHGLASMINLLGGITAELTEPEAAYISRAMGTACPPGIITLTGEAAMVHAMDSISDENPLGSLDRRLRLIESAVMNMRKTATKETMLPLLSHVFASIQTNLTISELQDIGYEILKAEDMELECLTIPAPDTFEPAENQEGITEGLTIDLEKNGRLLREAIQPEKE